MTKRRECRVVKVTNDAELCQNPVKSLVRAAVTKEVWALKNVEAMKDVQTLEDMEVTKEQEFRKDMPQCLLGKRLVYADYQAD